MERQIKLSFEPEAHVYKDETGLVYTSVTTVIGKYKKPFNNRYWSMYTALKNSGMHVRPDEREKSIVINGKYRSLDSLYSNPINTHEVKKLLGTWVDMTEAACARGNEIHDYLEDSINISKGDDGSSNDLIQPNLVCSLGNAGLSVELRTKHDLDDTNIIERFPAIYHRLLGYINKGCTIFAEKKIYTVQYGIAGMIDVLIVKGKQFAILDWKTNKDQMMFRSGYFKKVFQNNRWVKGDEYILRDKRLLAPLDNVEDCKGMVYSLQLSLYAYIMELWGYKLVEGGLEIFHLRPGLEPKLIPIKYMKQEVHLLLEHHKANNASKKVLSSKFGVK